MKSVTPSEQEALLAGLQFVIEQLAVQVSELARGEEQSTEFLAGVDATKHYLIRLYRAIEES